MIQSITRDNKSNSHGTDNSYSFFQAYLCIEISLKKEWSIKSHHIQFVVWFDFSFRDPLKVVSVIKVSIN